MVQNVGEHTVRRKLERYIERFDQPRSSVVQSGTHTQIEKRKRMETCRGCKRGFDPTENVAGSCSHYTVHTGE